MRIAYFDCFAGASGDMIIGALSDAGLSLDALKKELSNLNLTHYDVALEKVVKKGISGTHALVSVNEAHHRHHHRHLHDIEEIIGSSRLDSSVKQKSIRIFRRLAEAEARIHHTSIEKIHFHEVGAMDAIIDVVASVAGLHLMGIEKIICSPLHVGTGTVKCEHGVLPVPAPATLALIQGKPMYATGIKGELLTPTGAAILTTLASEFGYLPEMTVQSIGYGTGTADRDIPNLLRVIIGETADSVSGYESEQVAVIETSIDDMNPQIYEYVIETLLNMGVMDVFLKPIQMKKNRPGILVTVICQPGDVMNISDFLIRETTTIGLRWRTEHRIKTERVIVKKQTPYGDIRFKIARAGDNIVNVSPEYEDCKQIAKEKNIPLKTVMSVVSEQWSDD